jgi:hypothetical protein
VSHDDVGAMLPSRHRSAPALYDARRGLSIRTPSPPSPDDERWVAAYASRNGAASDARRESARRLLVLAYIMAVAMPPIGFGLGIVMAVRFRNLRSKHTAWIIVISILASIAWVLIISGGALNTPTTDY